jgi:hypothetical protein
MTDRSTYFPTRAIAPSARGPAPGDEAMVAGVFAMSDLVALGLQDVAESPALHLPRMAATVAVP